MSLITVNLPQNTYLNKKFLNYFQYAQILPSMVIPPRITKTLSYLKIHALKKSNPAKALELLRLLEEEVPADLTVKTLLAELLFENGAFQEASEALFIICLKQPTIQSLCYLLASTIHMPSFHLFFIDIQIHRRAASISCLNQTQTSFLQNLVGQAANKCGTAGIENKFIKAMVSRPKILKYKRCDLICALARIGCEDSEIVDQLGFKNTDEGPLKDSVYPMLSSGEFNLLYEVALVYIKTKRVVKALRILMKIYMINTIYGLLEFLVKREKFEVLYLLKDASPVFFIFYDSLLKNLQKSARIILATFLASPHVSEEDAYKLMDFI